MLVGDGGGMEGVYFMLCSYMLVVSCASIIIYLRIIYSPTCF